LRWRLSAIIGAAVLAVVASGGVAQATTKITADAGWESFITGGGIDGASIAGPWVFTSTSVAKVTVTDAFCRGDEFRVYDKDILLGDISEVASEFPACPFELFFPAIARADAALADPTFSQGVFFVAPGTHAIRVDSVTLAKQDCKNGGWKDYGSLFANQGECVSLAM
jgi:hypothetical protein